MPNRRLVRLAFAHRRLDAGVAVSRPNSAFGFLLFPKSIFIHRSVPRNYDARRASCPPARVLVNDVAVDAADYRPDGFYGPSKYSARFIISALILYDAARSIGPEMSLGRTLLLGTHHVRRFSVLFEVWRMVGLWLKADRNKA